MNFLGIDVSKAEFHAYLMQDGRCARHSFPNAGTGYTQLERWLRNRKAAPLHACMEATGAYWLGLALALHDGGHTVSVVNPARIHAFAKSQLRRTKTDGVDAEIIADFCRTQTPMRWAPPAPGVLKLRSLLTYRAQLVAEQLRLRQIRGSVQEARVLDKAAKTHAATLKKLLAQLEAQIHETIAGEQELSRGAALLCSIPGIGLVTAATVLAQLPAQLRNGKAAAAYAGLTPSERQSGTSVHGKPRICKTGNAQLRRAFYMPALTALRLKTSPLRSFAVRLQSAGKHGKVVIVAVMRKLLVLAFAILRSGVPFKAATAAAA